MKTDPSYYFCYRIFMVYGRKHNTSGAMISKSNIERDLIEKIEPVLENLGYECRDVEVITGGQACIRVTIDRSSREALSIEDCAQVHRVLGPMFDVWDPLPSNYTLEMSSPGEKPRMRTLEHFREACGEKIKFQTTEGIPMKAPSKPRKNWEAVLLEVLSDESGHPQIRVRDHDGCEHKVPLDLIKSAVWLRVWKP